MTEKTLQMDGNKFGGGKVLRLLNFECYRQVSWPDVRPHFTRTQRSGGDEIEALLAKL